MIQVEIPGRGRLELHHLVLDFNGTFAVDGKLLPGVADRLKELAEFLEIHVVTGDTNGTAQTQCQTLPVKLHILSSEGQAAQKREFVFGLQPRGAVCMGNGANDLQMMEAADLAMAVIGGEGCFAGTLQRSDIAVQHPNDGFDLLLRRNRLVATLRQ